MNPKNIIIKFWNSFVGHFEDERSDFFVKIGWWTLVILVLLCLLVVNVKFAKFVFFALVYLVGSIIGFLLVIYLLGMFGRFVVNLYEGKIVWRRSEEE